MKSTLDISLSNLQKIASTAVLSARQSDDAKLDTMARAQTKPVVGKLMTREVQMSQLKLPEKHHA